MARQNQNSGNEAKKTKDEAQASLEKRADKIKSEHGKVITTYRKSLDHAIRVGEYLD